MAPVPASVVRQAEQLRIRGNECYKKGRIGAAIDAYTESIVLFPNVAACLTNRALCFRKRREWGRVEEDCKKAIALDSNSVKGHYMLGLALLERQERDMGIMELEKAFELARGSHANHMVEEIWQVLSKAKYMKWELESNKQWLHEIIYGSLLLLFLTLYKEMEKGQVLVVLFKQICYVKDSRRCLFLLEKLKICEVCEEAIAKHILKGASEAEGAPEEAIRTFKEHMELLSQVFRKAEATDKHAEVPDHLCCKITLDILRDPVITPGGITYERAAILDHFRKVGLFDPVTREPLEECQLVPNLAVKEAVSVFLNEHGWAYKTTENPTVIID